MNTPEYVSPRELADRLNVSVLTVNALIADGTLPALTLGPRLRRIDVTEAEQVLRARGADG